MCNCKNDNERKLTNDINMNKSYEVLYMRKIEQYKYNHIAKLDEFELKENDYKEILFG